MTQLYRMQCGSCGIEYAIPEKMAEHAKANGGYHHCPNGHSWGWSKEGSEVTRLRRERDRLKQAEARLQDEIEDERRRTAAAKGQVTKLKNRAVAGVCPCCNRSFANLRRHMKAKHPDFTTDDKPDLKSIRGGKS